MSAASAAARGRRLAESMMTSTCTIRAKSAGRVTDPETGETAPTPGDLIYSGPCRIRPASGPAGNSQTIDAGGAEAFSFDYLVSVPFAVSTVREGHRLTVDSSPDPALIGAEVQIEHVDRGEHITARRLACSEVA